MGSSKKQTVGYWYHPAIHMVLGKGPIDAVLRIRGGDVDAWSGEVTSNATITIDNPNLWGGEEAEGGIQGDVDLMFGAADQLPNPAISSLIGPDNSAHRGHAALLFKGGRYGAMNPYPKPLSVMVRRIVKGWDGDACWYPEKAAIAFPDTVAPPEGWLVGSYSATLIGPRVVVTDPIDGFNEFTQQMAEQYGLAYAPIDASTEWLFFWRPNESGLIYSKREEGTVSNSITVQNLIDRGWQPDQTALIRFWSITGLHMCVYTLGSGSAPPPAPDGYSWAEGSDSPMNTTKGQVRLWQAREFLRGQGPLQGINPAHLIYYSLTAANMQGEPVELVNDASFRASAERLYNEGFGLCTEWDPDQETVEQFRQRICNVIAANCTRSTVNGQWYLDLVRGDYVLEDLPILTDDDILDFEAEPTLLDDAVNQVAVKWFDPLTKQARTTAPLHALGAIEANGINAETVDYSAIPVESLALRTAERDLRSKSTPLWRYTVTANRRPYSWRLGTYFRLQAPKRGIVDSVCLVGDIGKGTLRSGAISLVATQDVFAMPETTYVVGQPPVPPPDTTPAPVLEQLAIEAAYSDLAGTLSPGDLAALDPEAGYLLAVGARPGVGTNYQLYTRVVGDEFADGGRFDWCPRATVVEPSGFEDVSFTLADGFNLDEVAIGTAALWGSERVRVDALDTGTGAVTLGRACGDTVPVEHAAGEPIWFYDEWSASDGIEYVTAETVEAKLLTRSGTAMLPLDDAAALSVTFDQRAFRPYPPGLVRVNGAVKPPYATGVINLTWVHRDRLQQADQLVDTAAGSIGPEAGVTYTVRWYLNDVLEHTDVGIAGTLASYSPPGDGIVRIELEAVRDALASYQMHVREISYTNLPAEPLELQSGDAVQEQGGDLIYLMG